MAIAKPRSGRLGVLTPFDRVAKVEGFETVSSNASGRICVSKGYPLVLTSKRL